MTGSERGKLIWKLADLLEQNLEEFAELESLDNGKPVAVARVADVPLAADMFRYMGGWATKIDRQDHSRSRCPERLPLLHACANPSAWSARSFPGTSRC